VSAAYEAIVIGGGVNGLTAATLLARAGRRTLLLERREGIGGQARSAEFAPGFRSAALGSDAGWLPPRVAGALGLAVPQLVLPEATLAIRAAERDWLVLSRDIGRTAEAIRRYSPADAGKWNGFATRLAKHAEFLSALYTLPPPDVDAAGLRELLPLLGVARQLRGLGRRDMIELLRTVPMAVQDLLDDWFEGEALRAGIAASALRELRQGPRSGGTAFGLLHGQVGAAPGAIRGLGYWKTGPDALVTALAAAARANGVEIRAGADVAGILARDDRAVGVLLAGGEELAAPMILSSLDPARTLLGLVDPVWLDPEFLLAVRNIKFRGCAVKVSYALDGLPDFAGLSDAAVLRGTLSLSGSLLELERAADAAKYGAISERPHVELQLPTLRWPDLAPAGKHVLVAHAQWAPYRLEGGAWDAATRDLLSTRITRAIEQAAPGFGRLVLHQELLAPPDLEARHGLTEGAVSHGEMSLDQILFMRPVPGSAGYAMPLRGLYLCGAGAHPGHGVSGGPGWLAAKRALSDS
jgi:phytoene dehydrogenase-like protein